MNARHRVFVGVSVGIFSADRARCVPLLMVLAMLAGISLPRADGFSRRHDVHGADNDQRRHRRIHRRQRRLCLRLELRGVGRGQWRQFHRNHEPDGRRLRRDLQRIRGQLPQLHQRHFGAGHQFVHELQEPVDRLELRRQCRIGFRCLEQPDERPQVRRTALGRRFA